MEKSSLCACSKLPSTASIALTGRAIARQAGERTKVAVSSKDDKIDCVGACVGVRGSRIKNIVRELQGEKVDIVRWSEDIKEYVRAAISPAKVMTIDLHPEEKKMDIEVEDDQLSLAIGKRGQNVRLASKVVDWSINIKSQSQLQQDIENGIDDSSDDEVAVCTDDNGSLLSRIPGIGQKTLDALIEAGFDDEEALRNATADDLTKVKGVGKKRAEQIVEQIKTL